MVSYKLFETKLRDVNSLLVLQNFTTTRKSGNIPFTYYVVCEKNVASFSCCGKIKRPFIFYMPQVGIRNNAYLGNVFLTQR